MENVVGFLGSQAHRRLTSLLDRHGFQRLEFTLCPSRFGLPNLRPRVFIVASRRPLAARVPPDLPPPVLADFLDPEEEAGPCLDARDLRHLPGVDLVDAGAHRTACFIGGYGRKFMGSGSFLATPQGIRRFSPREIARLLGYPPSFRFPDELPLVQRYKLLGNGLSLPVARWVLGHLPD
jgi:site-specific DNA-cytosine methylase